jgi:hypothetical protein
MSRMSVELGLVLLGSGILSAGYFLAPSPEEEMEKKTNDQMAQRTGHNNSTHYRSGGFFLFVHSPAYSGSGTGRPNAYSPSARSGGFGSSSRGFSSGS